MSAFVRSVNVGQPRVVAWRGEAVATGIFKSSVSGPVRVSFLNIAGDGQADLSVHGGRDKAVYAYPFEHYLFWRTIFADRELPWGQFGENLTTEGLLEDDVRVGDRFRIATASFEVTQPRIPCFKLGITFDDQRMVKRFLESRRTGFYLRVISEGELAAGDEIERIGAGSVSIADVLNAKFGPPANPSHESSAIS